MIAETYLKQVQLLIRIIPVIATEDCFAVHGGTAINLFLSNMPRLSVDIDLTYIPVETRENSLIHITQALNRIRENLYKNIPGIQIAQLSEGKDLKLFCNWKGSQVKVEVNTVIRGIVSDSKTYPLCKYAQLHFNQYCEISIVPVEQLYGGKICAALNRQHPRDLFDIKCLLENNESIVNYKRGFLFCLLSSDRPIHETLQPNKIDQHLALENQFRGMTAFPFSYNDYEETRITLIQLVQASLSNADKSFLLDFKQGTPEWDSSEYANFINFPSVQWKLINILKLKEKNPAKHLEEFERLKSILRN